MRSCLLFLTCFLINTEHLPSQSFELIPKVELHLHLGGAYPLDYLFTIATEEQKANLVYMLDLISKGIDYHEGFQVFPLVSQIVDTDAKVEQGVELLCKSLQKDGVVYAEIRTGLKDLGNGLEGYLQSVLRGMHKANSERFESRLLLSLKRSSSLSLAQATVDLALKYRDRGIVGIDLSGDSTLGQVDNILSELKRAKQAGLYLTVHLGESLEEQGQCELLNTLCPDRIGHGVFLTPEAREWILTHQVPIEVCPTSSVLVKMIEAYDAHPALQDFLLHRHPIVICTDDPLVFSNTLSSELMTLGENTSLSEEQLQHISRQAIEYAFLTPEEKQTLIAKHFFSSEL
jgi:adenosine deaminase